MTDEHIIDWARKKFERTAKRIDIGVPFGDKAEDALWFVAPRLFAAVDERDALRKRNLDLIGALGTADGKIADLRKQVEKLERDLARARESGLQSCQLLKECGERVAELETSLHEARMLLPYEWRKEPE